MPISSQKSRSVVGRSYCFFLLLHLGRICLFDVYVFYYVDLSNLELVTRSGPDSALVEGLVKTSSFLIEFGPLDGVWYPNLCLLFLAFSW